MASRSAIRHALGAVLLLRLPAAGALAAQATGVAARLTVRVVDSAGRALPFAELSLPELGQRYSADTYGRLKGLKLRAGTYRVAARAIGFRPRSLTLQLSAGELRDTTIALSAWPARLPDVTVFGEIPGVGDLYDRLRARGGRIITRVDIDRSAAITAGLLLGLSGVFGLRVENTPMSLGGPTVSFSGCRFRYSPVVAVWLDGTEMVGSPFPAGDIARPLELVRAHELEFMEVYRRPEEIPGKFRSMDACAALVMWTRDFIRNASRYDHS